VRRALAKQNNETKQKTKPDVVRRHSLPKTVWEDWLWSGFDKGGYQVRHFAQQGKQQQPPPPPPQSEGRVHVNAGVARGGVGVGRALGGRSRGTSLGGGSRLR